MANQDDKEEEHLNLSPEDQAHVFCWVGQILNAQESADFELFLSRLNIPLTPNVPNRVLSQLKRFPSYNSKQNYAPQSRLQFLTQSLLGLPDIRLYILSYLSLRDLVQACCVCRDWMNHVPGMTAVWQNAFRRECSQNHILAIFPGIEGKYLDWAQRAHTLHRLIQSPKTYDSLCNVVLVGSSLGVELGAILRQTQSSQHKGMRTGIDADFITSGTYRVGLDLVSRTVLYNSSLLRLQILDSGTQFYASIRANIKDISQILTVFVMDVTNIDSFNRACEQVLVALRDHSITEQPIQSNSRDLSYTESTHSPMSSYRRQSNSLPQSQRGFAEETKVSTNSSPLKLFRHSPDESKEIVRLDETSSPGFDHPIESKQNEEMTDPFSTLVSSRNLPVPICLVGVNAHLFTERAVECSLAEQFAMNQGISYMECNVFDPVSVDKLLAFFAQAHVECFGEKTIPTLSQDNSHVGNPLLRRDISRSFSRRDSCLMQ